MSEYELIVHPERLKDTAKWIVQNLSPDQYPAIKHFPNDTHEIIEYFTHEYWEDLAYFDHYDTVITSRLSVFGPIEGERTPRRHHMIFKDQHAWALLKLLQ